MCLQILLPWSPDEPSFIKYNGNEYFPLFTLPQCFPTLIYTLNIHMFKHNLFIITCLQRSPLYKRQTSSFCFNHALLKLKSSNSGCLEATLSSVTNEWYQTKCLLLYSQPLPSTVPFPRKHSTILFSHLFCRYLFKRTVEGIQKPKGK